MPNKSSPNSAWFIVAGSFISQMFALGFFTYSVSLMTTPVMTEFDTGVEQVMYGLTIGSLAGLFFMPFGGFLIDKYPPRVIISIGTLIFAGGIYLLANSASIEQYSIIFGLTMAATYGLAGSTVCSATVARNFSENRGKALGISATGSSAGGAVVPIVLAFMITDMGWRQAFEVFSFFLVAAVLPCIWLFIKGKASHSPTGHTGQPVEQLSTKDILLNPNFWFIGLTLGLFFCAYNAMLANLAPYSTDIGISTQKASAFITVLAISGFIGKILFGIAADRINLKLSLWGAIGLVTISLLVLSAEPQYLVILLTCSALGLASGGMLPIWGSMIANIFGIANHGRAMGLTGPLITLLVMPGFALMGFFYDSYQSYQPAIIIFAGVSFVSAITLIPLKLNK